MIKDIIKFVASIIAFILLIPLFLLYFIRILSFFTVAQILSVLPGNLGFIFRRVWYKCTLAKCGKNFSVDFLGWVRSPKSTVGDNVYIGVNSCVGLADIGDDTMISGFVIVLSGSGQHGIKRLDVPMRLQEGKVECVSIGKDCWIGAGAIIHADVADHSVVGCGSVVTRKFAPYDVLAGVPAKKIKSRKGGVV